MPKSKKPSKPASKNPFVYKGVDLMAGPEIRTRPTTTKSNCIPQRRLNMGMDRWPT